MLLLLVKPAVISLVLAALLASPRKTLVAAVAPGLCDFSHKTGLPFAERCRIQQFLASAPLAKPPPLPALPKKITEEPLPVLQNEALLAAERVTAEPVEPVGFAAISLEALTGVEVAPTPILQAPPAPQQKPWCEIVLVVPSCTPCVADA